jgi:peptide/nickel transport system permease protein
METNSIQVGKQSSQLAIMLRHLWADKVSVTAGFFLLVVILLCASAPILGLRDPTEIVTSLRNKPIGTYPYILGGDGLGRDILSRLIWGGRVSLRVAFYPVLLSVIIGSVIGLVSGYYGGLLDGLLMRLLDILLAFPTILLALGLAAALGAGVENAVLAITVVTIPALSRIVRSSVLPLRNSEFVIAGRACGANTIRLLVLYIFPNVIGPVVVYATLETGRVIIMASTLSFLGLGVQPPIPDWGAMLEDGRRVLHIAPHVATIPGIVIFLVTLAFNLLGDGLRDAIDPRKTK